ncbi:MAG: rhodanese-like domain-containing protein [Acidimicrobiia bacterium]|nr:rhodanese-like domain-containing protein [Acidimicrobiia bacterium]
MNAAAIPTSLVTAVPAAPSAEVIEHFGRLLSFETDCWDVHQERRGRAESSDVVVLDVRGPAGFASGHVPGAVNLPHRSIAAEAVALWPARTTFVVYCAGPHCNAADQAALRLARLGRPVKKMLGGIEGWKAEGFSLETSS